MELIFPALYLYPFWGSALYWRFCRSSGPTVDYRIRVLIAIVVGGSSSLIFTPAVFGTEGFAFFVPWWVRFLDKQHTHAFSWAGAAVFGIGVLINLLTGASAKKEEKPPAPRHSEPVKSHQMLAGLSRPAAKVENRESADKLLGG